MSYHWLRPAALVLGLVTSVATWAVNPPPGDPYAATGPYSTTSESGGLSCTIFRPRTLGQDGMDHPVILWGNGTGARPSTYADGLEHWASHGFVVAAADTSNAGSGEQMLGCLDYLIRQNGRPGSVYYGNLDTSKVGTSGHSQGGGGSIMAGTDPRITATAPMQPYTIGLGHELSSQYNQVGPMFLMTGGSDSIAAPGLNAAPVFRRANVPVFWGELEGASHFEPVGDFGGYRGASTAWFRYHLMGDQQALGYFYGNNCSLCTNSDWTVQRKNIN